MLTRTRYSGLLHHGAQQRCIIRRHPELPPNCTSLTHQCLSHRPPTTCAAPSPCPPPAGHGLGHATRVIEVTRHLLEAGHAVTLVSGASLAAHTRDFPPDRFAIRNKLLDCGSSQVGKHAIKGMPCYPMSPHVLAGSLR